MNKLTRIQKNASLLIFGYALKIVATIFCSNFQKRDYPRAGNLLKLVKFENLC